MRYAAIIIKQPWSFLQYEVFVTGEYQNTHGAKQMRMYLHALLLGVQPLLVLKTC
jgi:hypothetical protein